MAENIELHSFCISTNTGSDVEEYHEITQQVETDQNAVFPPTPPKIKEFDFFTKFDVKPSQKLEHKKKRSHVRKKETSNLMDIVNFELASVAIPVTKEIIVTMREEREKEQSSYLLRLPSVQSLFRRSQRLRPDYENGWRRKEFVKLSPIFPRILENAMPDYSFVPVQYVDSMSFEEFMLKQSSEESKGHEHFLDIAIKSIKFKHHHLNSLEKMLCDKLIKYYETYQVSEIAIKDLSRDIKVNREAKNNVKQELLRISPKKKDDIRFDKTIRKYSAKLVQSKQDYIKLIKQQKEIVHKITSLWSDIEMIREKSGKTVTPYFLEIVNKDIDEKRFDEEWAEVFDTEFNDLLDKLEYEYVSRYEEYKIMKNDQNLEVSEKKKLTKPKLVIDEEVLKEEVDEIVNGIVTRNQLDMVLKKDNSFLSTKIKSGQMTLNYHFEIYVDSVFVCKSERFSCTEESLFEIESLDTFSIQILPKNKSIAIALMENDEKVSVLQEDLLKIDQNYNSAGCTSYTFIYKNVIIQPTHKYVGSGFNIKEIAKENKVRLKSSNIFEGKLETNCEVCMKIGWNEKLYHNQSEILKASYGIGKEVARLMHGIKKPNVDLLLDLINKIYGRNIVSDEKLTRTLHNICKTKIKTNLEFHVDENNPDLIRFKLLHLRNVGGFTNIDNKMIPLHASQLSTEQLNCLQNSSEKDIDVEYINQKYSETHPIELQRFIGCKYVQKLNQNMLKNLHDHLMKKTHKDVVRDYRDLSMRNLFKRQSNLTTLASMPKSTKQQYLNDSICKEQEIQVTVARAFNLLDRSSTILTEDYDEDNSTIAGFKVRPLRPYVRLSYHGISTKTATAIGCHPTWNQTVNIKTKLQPLASLHINLFDEYKTNVNEGDSDDGSSQGKMVHYQCCSRWIGALQVPLHAVITAGTLRGTFKITTPPLLLGYDVLQNKDATYSLIPEVTQLLRKDASFISLRITTSLSHLGGLQTYNQPVPSSVDDDDLIKHLNNVVTDYTNDFPTRNITLTFIDSSGRNRCVTQFLRPISLPSYECFPRNPKSRTESALSKCSGVSKSSSSKSGGGRKRDTDVERASQSPSGRESIYSGFEANWKGESQVGKMMNACLRYVALIPTYEVTESHVVTLMGLELLKVLYGSHLDHTILLASYLLYLGIKCWVVIGNGLPRGRSSYVLTKYDLARRRDVLVTDQVLKGKGFLKKCDGYMWNVYDATTGERFELRDVSCPLKTVDYFFDDENVWLNMQSSQDCESVSFDLSKSSNWMSVFDKTIFVMKQPLAKDSNLYSAPPDVAALQEMLESKIKIKIQKWRTHLKTIWNRYCSSLLREVLPHWEYWTFNPGEPKPVLAQRLKQLMITYKLFGFPLNVPYVNVKAIISTVKSTGLHVNDEPNVEYGLAVEVYAYPNNVLSVWVFLASITRI